MDLIRLFHTRNVATVQFFPFRATLGMSATKWSFSFRSPRFLITFAFSLSEGKIDFYGGSGRGIKEIFTTRKRNLLLLLNA